MIVAIALAVGLLVATVAAIRERMERRRVSHRRDRWRSIARGDLGGEDGPR